MAARTKDKEPTPPPGRPLIGINTDYLTPKNAAPFLRLNVGYVDAILAAGAMPVLLPPLRKENLAELDSVLDQLAGIVLTGGADMDPRRNGQALSAAVNPMPARREDADRYLLTRIFERKLPVLGIGLPGVGFCLMVATTLHSVAVGNLLPAWVKVACIDINPATVTKLMDRGSTQTVGIVSDAEPFLRSLVTELQASSRPASAVQ
jgi:hypothetical protein